MVKTEDLKRINMFKNAPEHILEILAKEAQLSIFGAETELMTINEPVDTFYMLIMGQVAIKKEFTPEIDVILDYIQSGSSLGTSAMIEGSVAFYTAVCMEPCELITLSGERMLQLFKENHELAYYIMIDVSQQYKRYMDKQTLMLMKTLEDNTEPEEDIYDAWINGDRSL